MARQRSDAEKQIANLLLTARNSLGLSVAFLTRLDETSQYLELIESSAPLPFQEGHGRRREVTFCHAILDGRLPSVMPDVRTYPEAMALTAGDAAGVRGFASVPVVLSDGTLYGTFCAAGLARDEEISQRDKALMEVLAQAAARGSSPRGSRPARTPPRCWLSAWTAARAGTSAAPAARINSGRGWPRRDGGAPSAPRREAVVPRLAVRHYGDAGTGAVQGFPPTAVSDRGGAVAVGPISQIHIGVRNIYSSIGFYRDILGVPFLFQVPGRPVAYFQSGDVRLCLAKPESPEQATKVFITFRVNDLDAEYARLSRIGIDFVQEPHLVRRSGLQEVRMAMLRDLDGHHIALVQERLVG